MDLSDCPNSEHPASIKHPRAAPTSRLRERLRQRGTTTATPAPDPGPSASARRIDCSGPIGDLTPGKLEYDPGLEEWPRPGTTRGWGVSQIRASLSRAISLCSVIQSCMVILESRCLADEMATRLPSRVSWRRPPPNPPLGRRLVLPESPHLIRPSRPQGRADAASWPPRPALSSRGGSRRSRPPDGMGLPVGSGWLPCISQRPVPRWASPPWQRVGHR